MRISVIKSKCNKFILLCASVILFSSQVQANLISNPGFEDSLNGWSSSGVVSILNGNAATDWWVRSGGKSLNMNPIDLMGDTNIWQNFTTPASNTYEYGAYVRLIADPAAGNLDQIQASVFGSGINAVTGTDPNTVQSRFGSDGVFATTDWIFLGGTFDAEAGSPALFAASFQDFNPQYTGVIVDDIFVNAVQDAPEPATVSEPSAIMLLAMGLLGFALMRRRHQS